MKKTLFLMLVSASMLMTVLPGCGRWWRRSCEDTCEDRGCRKQYIKRDCNRCGDRHAGRCADGSCEAGAGRRGRGHHHEEMMMEE